MRFDAEAVWERYGEALIAGALNVLAAAFILGLGLRLAAWASTAVRRLALKHPRIDNTLASFFAWIVRYALVGFVIIAVLNRFGVATTSIVAVLGAATLAIGLALQGTLSNLAAGVMLILFRPYRLGDDVLLANVAGTVMDINLFTTELKTPDNSKVTLPNGLCWGAPMTNYSAYSTRRLDLEFSIAHGADIPRALALLDQTLDDEPLVLADPAPIAQVRGFTDFGVTLWTRAWVRSKDYLSARAALLLAGRDRLAHEGFSPTSHADNRAVIAASAVTEPGAEHLG